MLDTVPSACQARLGPDRPPPAPSHRGTNFRRDKQLSDEENFQTRTDIAFVLPTSISCALRPWIVVLFGLPRLRRIRPRPPWARSSSIGAPPNWSRSHLAPVVSARRRAPADPGPGPDEQPSTRTTASAISLIGAADRRPLKMHVDVANGR